MARKFFVGGNFKMNGTHESLIKLVDELNSAKLDESVEVVIAPPALYLLPLRDALRKEISVSAQNAYKNKEGAFTGEISAWQLKEEKIHWVILGHSERRSIFKESDNDVAEKTVEAIEQGLQVILCVGESLEEREADKTAQVVERQLQAVVDKKPDWSKIVIAYEPVWAIGTGKVATPQQAQEVHAGTRAWLKKTVSSDVAEATRIIYGGSVKGDNAATLASQADIDGFLVGGASLKPEFVTIINSQSKSGKL